MTTEISESRCFVKKGWKQNKKRGMKSKYFNKMIKWKKKEQIV